MAWMRKRKERSGKLFLKPNDNLHHVREKRDRIKRSDFTFKSFPHFMPGHSDTQLLRSLTTQTANGAGDESIFRVGILAETADLWNDDWLCCVVVCS